MITLKIFEQPKSTITNRVMRRFVQKYDPAAHVITMLSDSIPRVGEQLLIDMKGVFVVREVNWVIDTKPELKYVEIVVDKLTG